MKLLFLLLIISSCRSVLYHKSEQCSPAFAYVDETKKLIDVDKSLCSVREYEFAVYRVGPMPGTDRVEPLPYCDRCVGFKKYSEVQTFWEQVRRAISREKEQ
jgi:hypothetical protein